MSESIQRRFAIVVNVSTIALRHYLTENYLLKGVDLLYYFGNYVDYFDTVLIDFYGV